MIALDDFNRIVIALGDVGQQDIAWSESLCPPPDAETFALEVIFVICNSGMKNTVARGIYDRCTKAVAAGKSSGTVFGHKGKASAIDLIWRDRERLFRDYLAAADKLDFCRRLPWIGPITCYHVAKNFGADVSKPDVHLQRLADQHGCTAQELCADLARQTGYRTATVDTLIWRACANGIIDSKTGAIRAVPEAAIQFTPESWRHA